MDLKPLRGRLKGGVTASGDAGYWELWHAGRCAPSTIPKVFSMASFTEGTAEGLHPMSAIFRARVALILAFLAALSGCSAFQVTGVASPAEQAAAAREDFAMAQFYRTEALNAYEHGDSASALLYVQKAQALVPRAERTALTPSTTVLQPEHRAIAPAGGSTTCYNIGINRFACF